MLTGTPVTREQLAAAVGEQAGRHPADVLLSGWVLKPMAARRQLAFGPPDGRTVTFVAPRAWVGQWSPVDPDEAVQDVLRAFWTGTARPVRTSWSAGRRLGHPRRPAPQPDLADLAARTETLRRDRGARPD